MTRSMASDDQLTDPEAGEEQQHARHGGRERDRDMFEECVDAEARREDHEDTGRH